MYAQSVLQLSMDRIHVLLGLPKVNPRFSVLTCLMVTIALQVNFYTFVRSLARLEKIVSS